MSLCPSPLCFSHFLVAASLVVQQQQQHNLLVAESMGQFFLFLSDVSIIQYSDIHLIFKTESLQEANSSRINNMSTITEWQVNSQIGASILH
jgi:hypothetical protein